MILSREVDSDLLSCMRSIKPGTAINDVIAAYILSALERNQGNRTWTSWEIGMALRTFRNHLKYIEAMGYPIPESKKRFISPTECSPDL